MSCVAFRIYVGNVRVRWYSADSGTHTSSIDLGRLSGFTKASASSSLSNAVVNLSSCSHVPLCILVVSDLRYYKRCVLCPRHEGGHARMTYTPSVSKYSRSQPLAALIDRPDCALSPSLIGVILGHFPGTIMTLDSEEMWSLLCSSPSRNTFSTPHVRRWFQSTKHCSL